MIKYTAPPPTLSADLSLRSPSAKHSPEILNHQMFVLQSPTNSQGFPDC